MPNLDEKLLEAMKIPRKIRLSVWDAALQEHKTHATFRVQTWAYTLEYGFTCACSGTEHEWRIFIGDLKAQLPAARESCMRLFRHHAKAGNKLQRREQAKATMRAKALLHRYLTKEQRIELRNTKAFTMRGKDGRRYHITTGSCTNVFIEHEGQRFSLCVIPKDWLPTYDTMLAQKVMLETDPEAFLRLARVKNVKTQEYFESGGFLCGDVPLPLMVRSIREPLSLVELTNEQVMNPQEWVAARLEAAPPSPVVQTLEVVEEQAQEQVEQRLV
jgi:hypothetical protein